jgi:rare lipoprotein A
LRSLVLNSVSYHPKKRMTLKRTTFLTSGLLLLSFYLLLSCVLALPTEARTQRIRKVASPAAALTYATVLRGRASWYGREHQGMRTSSGERFNRFKYTCAHKTLPFGTRLRVTNVLTGKSVVVRVSDRGPFRHQRILDLAEVAARPLGIVTQGAASVIAQVVPGATPLGPADAPANLLAIEAADPNPAAAFTTYELPSAADSAAVAALSVAPAAASSPAPAAPTNLVAAAVRPASRFLVQAGTFADSLNAQAMRTRLLAIDPALAVEIQEEILDGRSLQRVLISQLDTWLAAEAVRRRLHSKGVASLVRQVPNQTVVAVALPVSAVAIE